MFNAGTILGYLGLDTSGFSGGMLKAQGIAQAFGPMVSSFIANPILGAVQAGKKLLDLFGQQERAEIRLEAMVKASGNAHGFTTEQLKAQAAALREVTVHGDESIMSVQALLSSFVQIKGDTFERATEMALNMSDAFDQDLKSSAIQLGKALNDPVAGLSALSRVGVSFSEQEKEMIKQMVAANDVVGAQNMMLQLMADQGLGGVARAMGESSSGGLQQFMNSLSDLGETLGGVIAPVLSAVTTLLKPFLELLKPVAELLGYIMKGIAAPISAIGNFLGDALKGGSSPSAAGPTAIVNIRPEDSARQIADQLAPAIASGTRAGVRDVNYAIQQRAVRGFENVMAGM